MRSVAAALLLLVVPFVAGQQNEQPNALLLIAKPELQDPNFRETVVLVTQAADASTVGVILNRPTNRRTAKGEPLWFGGPVMREVTVALFRAERAPSAAAFPVLKGLYLSLHPANIESLAPGERHRLFSGFAGWAPGQLQGELARDAWYVLPPRDELLFRKDTSGLWRELMEKARGGRAERQIKPDILS